ncbi:hypothetical protein CWE09_03540 [Aliidiomarina minuta]|uniref:Uncharacterized protein n=1 Tax=Aliidiomarina minuta TaxID=880057 RepID=A0A432W6W6_9GAMM|nr:hypothetical protein [Aliidiomarina minuta]RUO25815.1 hypothetical protein CWE09_03540 [Aliidiomarina minuta]
MNQSTLFQPLQQAQFTELCIALYERELLHLSREGPDNALFLKRRLASLPFYVERAAHALNRIQTPLLLDTQNASWQSKQKLKPPAAKHDPQGLQNWLQKHARLALVVPVQSEQQGIVSVMLDSIDRISEAGVHVNQYGWFDWQGQPIAKNQQSCLLLKPDKASMSAACCGHQWAVSGRVAPRTLNLREVLLAATLRWPKFTSVQWLPD